MCVWSFMVLGGFYMRELFHHPETLLLFPITIFRTPHLPSCCPFIPLPRLMYPPFHSSFHLSNGIVIPCYIHLDIAPILPQAACIVEIQLWEVVALASLGYLLSLLVVMVLCCGSSCTCAFLGHDESSSRLFWFFQVEE